MLSVLWRGGGLFAVQPCEAARWDQTSSSFPFPPQLTHHFILPLNASPLLSPLSASSASPLCSSSSSLFTSLALSHCHLVLTPSPQSLHSSSSGDEVQLFDGVLPLAGESHPPGVGVASARPCSASAVGVPSAVHAHPGHGGGAAVVVVARRRVGVHLDHVVAVHGGRDADVLLRLGLLVVAEPAHGGHHPASCSSVAPADYQTHRNQPVLQTVGWDQKPLVGPGTTDWFILSDIWSCSRVMPE